MVHKVGNEKHGHETATAVHSMSDPGLHADKWSASGFGSISVEDRNLKVGHFVEQSGEGYNLAFDNCRGAADRMMDLSKPKWQRDLEWMDRQN